MTEEIKTELAERAVTEDWEVFVKSEVTALLETLLPACQSGKIGIQYKNLVIEETESGLVYNENKAVGVDVVLSFDFGGEIKKPV